MIKKYFQRKKIEKLLLANTLMPIFKTGNEVKSLGFVFSVENNEQQDEWLQFIKFLQGRKIRYKGIGVFREDVNHIPSCFIGHPHIQVISKKELDWLKIPTIDHCLGKESFDVFINGMILQNFTASYISASVKSTLKIAASTVDYHSIYQLFIELKPIKKNLQEYLTGIRSYLENHFCNIQHIHSV